MTDEATATVMGMLLLELTEALMARGALKREDVAGALLRTEFRADMQDDFDEEEGAIIRPHGGWARLATEEWSKRLGLPPEIYTLRSHHEAWQGNGSKGQNPWEAAAVAALFDEPEQP